MIVPDDLIDGGGAHYTAYYDDVKDICGLDTCIWGSGYRDLLAHKDDIISLFDEVYAYREVGAETTNRFKHFLQCRLDTISEGYDRGYRLYSTADIDSLVLSQTSTISTTDEDTPDTALSGTYASARRTAETSVSTPMSTPLESATKNYKKWLDLTTEFVNEFETLFIGTVTNI